jgi:KUP system potassium uptake protein
MTKLCLGALGVVFGDIGTSPLYAFKECLRGPHGAQPTPANVLGVLSLIVWSLTLVVTLKYLIFIMRAHNRGEGGIFALLALLPDATVNRHRMSVFVVLGVIGAALLYGDGVITPAISVLSAVEGLELAAPHLHRVVVPLTCLTLVGLFAIQRRGTGDIGKLFGPVMLLWFLVIGSVGAAHVVENPAVLAALSPWHAIDFFIRHGLRGTLILGAVVLAVTGGEALYADMGHFGARPIRLAWFVVVFPALLAAYFGQGALVLADPSTADNPFYLMVPSGWPSFGLVLLASLATVIASQALISGVFSLTQQAVQLGFLPRVSIRHTARDAEGQVYVPVVNGVLAVACIALVLGFQASHRLASAYGIAVSGTMAITSLVFFEVAHRRWRWSLGASLGLLFLFLSFDLPFLAANAVKILDGGYVPIGMGAIFVTIMLVWKSGQLLFAEQLEASSEPLLGFVEQADSALQARVPGTAVFVTYDVNNVPPAMLRQVRAVPVLQKNVLVVGVKGEHVPMLEPNERCNVRALPHGFYQIVARFGFMEEPDLPAVLRRVTTQYSCDFNPDSTTYYLQRETFLATSDGKMGPIREGLFSLLSRNARPADAYLKIPPINVVEIGAQYDL